MKTSDWILLGGAGVAALWLSSKFKSPTIETPVQQFGRGLGESAGDAGVELGKGIYSFLSGAASAPYNAGVEYREELYQNNTNSIINNQQGQNPLGFYFDRKVADFLNNPFQPLATNPNNSAEILAILSWLNPSV